MDRRQASLHRSFGGGAFPGPQRLASVRISLPRMDRLGPIIDGGLAERSVGCVGIWREREISFSACRPIVAAGDILGCLMKQLPCLQTTQKRNVYEAALNQGGHHDKKPI
jgi:hypothetical protein